MYNLWKFKDHQGDNTHLKKGLEKPKCNNNLMISESKQVALQFGFKAEHGCIMTGFNCFIESVHGKKKPAPHFSDLKNSQKDIWWSSNHLNRVMALWAGAKSCPHCPACEQMAVWRALKSPGGQLCWLWTLWANTNNPHHRSLWKLDYRHSGFFTSFRSSTEVSSPWRSFHGCSHSCCSCTCSDLISSFS